MQVGAFVDTKYGPSLQPGIIMGLEVGRARTKYIALAKKDVQENVDERYALPNFHAQGTSNHVQAQRAHQHIFWNI